MHHSYKLVGKINRSIGKNRNSRAELLVIALVLVVLTCVNHLFDLTQWGHVHGVFNASDIGLFLLFIMFATLVLRRKPYLLANNGFSILVLLYLFFVVIQAAIVSFNFGQAIIDGLIAIRHQFYYLSFFVFLAVLDSTEAIERYLNVITGLAIILVVIGIINYSGITLYDHKWAEGHGIRSGVVRAYIAGMDVVTMGLFWLIACSVMDNQVKLRRGVGIALLLVGHVLEQARGRIIGFFVAVVYVLFVKRKYKTLAGGAVLFLVSVLVAGIVMEENILLTPFTTTATDISKGTGSWSGRLQQMEVDISVFMEHPYFGSGTSALRVTEGQGQTGPMIEDLSALARKEDLGYSHWMKAYGIPGILWLVAFLLLLYRYFSAVRRPRDPRHERIALAATGYLSFVVVSFITLPHFMRPDLIILLCLALALLVRISQFCRVPSNNSTAG